MKPTLLLLFTLLGATVSAQTFTQSPPTSDVSPDAILTAAKASVSNGVLTISLKSDGDAFTAWTHVFIDLGPAAEPSYNHSSGSPAGQSLELLFEGAQVYRFTGERSDIWSWTPIADATVERTISGAMLTLKTDLAPLGLPSGDNVKIFAATYTDKYSDTLDTLPRTTRAWSFAVPKHTAR